MKKCALVIMMAMMVTLAGCSKEKAATNEAAAPQETAAEVAAEPAKEAGADSAEAAADGKDIKMAVVFKTLNSEYWGNVKDGSLKAATELGIDCTILGANDETQITEQVTILEEQLSLGIDALVVAPIEESAVIGALEQYVNETAIVFVDSDADLAGKKAFVGTGNKTAAKKGGEYIASLLEKGSKVVLIGGQQGESTSTERLQGFEEAMNEAGIEVLETQYGKNVADSAMAVMEDLLTKYPGEISAVLSMNDDMALGCMEAVSASGEEILILGFDGNKAALDAIQAGGMTCTVAQQPFEMGYKAVMQAYEAALGNEIEAVQEVDIILISKDNVAEHIN